MASKVCEIRIEDNSAICKVICEPSVYGYIQFLRGDLRKYSPIG